MAASAGGIRAGKAFVELLAKDGKLVKGLKRAQARLKRFSAATTAMGAKLFGGGAALAAPLLGAAKSFASMGDQIQKTTFRSGMSAETLSQLAFAAQQSGIDVEKLDRALTGMARTFVDGARGSSEIVDSLNRLGLNMQQLEAMTPEERFNAIADALSRIKDPTLRAGLAMKVFGRSGRDMLPLIDQGAAGINELRREADRLGLTMSTEDANAAAALTDAMGRLTSQLKVVLFQVGAALAPVLLDIAGRMKEVGRRVIEWVKANKPLIVTALKVAAVIMGAGSALIALGAAFASASVIVGGVVSTITAVGAVLGALLSPIGLVIAGLGALAGWFLTSTAAGASTLSWLGGKFGDLKDTALAGLQGIKDALAAGDFKLAARILWLSLKMAWLQGTRPLREIWFALVNKMEDLWTDTVFNLAALWAQSSALIKKGWAHTTSFIQDAWVVVSTAVQNTWYKVVAGLEKAWIRFKSLIGEKIDVKAETQRIDRMTRAKIGVNQRLQDEMISSSERQRKSTLANVEQARTGTLAELEKGRLAARAKHSTEFDKALADTSAALDAAKKEWKDALKEASGAAAKKADADQKTGPALPNTLKSLFDQVAAGAAGGVKAATKTDITGSFSAFAARGMGEVLGPQEKIEMHTKQTASQTKKMAQALKDLSLTFA